MNDSQKGRMARIMDMLHGHGPILPAEIDVMVDAAGRVFADGTLAGEVFQAPATMEWRGLTKDGQLTEWCTHQKDAADATVSLYRRREGVGHG